MSDHHLAQINVGRLVAPLDDPQVAGFVSQLDEINELAERSPGFIWRLKSDSGNATDIPYNDDPTMLVNMSVWESVETLKSFTYQTRHLQVVRQRHDWFQKMTEPHYCLWWVPAGHVPSVAEGRERLDHYIRFGATPEAFWFSELFPAPALDALLR
jgi:hypothetical protein